jgi:hypothetical protein
LPCKNILRPLRIRKSLGAEPLIVAEPQAAGKRATGAAAWSVKILLFFGKDGDFTQRRRDAKKSIQDTEALNTFASLRLCVKSVLLFPLS